MAILAAEAVPYSKTGGLGDVAGALPKALKQIGVDSVLITPLYRQTKGEFIQKLAVNHLPVNWRGRVFNAQAFYSEANGSPTFLIDAPQVFHRDSIYGYTEDYERFAFFCEAALALLKHINVAPDVVHLNDWHTGFAAAKIAHLRFWDSFWRNTRTVFSIHNMAYQGGFGMNQLWDLGFGSDFERNAFAFNGYASALKAGLATADILSTVSPRYSYEIQTEKEGYGLDWLLRQRSDKLFGIVNGVDYEVWNPATDPELPAHFSKENLSGKMICKRDLLQKFGLPVDLDKPDFRQRHAPDFAKRFRVDSADGFRDFKHRRVFYFTRFGRKNLRRFFAKITQYRAATSRRLSRLQRIARSSNRSRRGYVFDAVALRAVRFESNVFFALRHSSDCSRRRRFG